MEEKNNQVDKNIGNKKGEKNVAMAFIAYILFFVPLLTDSKNDPFVKFHIKQGLILFIFWVASCIIGEIPVIGWTLFPFLSIIGLILFIFGIINALNSEKKELPVIGKYARHFNF